MGTDMRHSLASTVEVARVHAGVSATRLAELSGVEPDALVDLLEGRVDFTIVDLARIAAALGVPITELLPASVPDEPGSVPDEPGSVPDEPGSVPDDR